MGGNLFKIFSTSGLAIIGFAIAPLLAEANAGNHPIISEFLADNGGTLLDGAGLSGDWIEILNPTNQSLDLGGHSLTDNPAEPTKWLFPAGTTIDAGSRLIVFASGLVGDEIPEGELHASFKLGKEGEYLGLFGNNGMVLLQEFSPTFPEQFEDVSYGILESGPELSLLQPGNAATAFVPLSRSALPSDWAAPGFNPSDDWTAGVLPAAFKAASSVNPFARWKLEAGSGQAIIDATGNGFDGVLGSSDASEAIDPRWTTDTADSEGISRGTVLGFDGGANNSDSMYVDLSDNASIFGNLQQGAITAWVRSPTSVSSDPKVILGASDGGDASRELRFFINNGRLAYGVRGDSDSTSPSIVTGGPNINDDRWHHAAVVVDSSETRLYLDGSLIGSGSAAFFADVSGLDQMAIGRNKDSGAGGGQWFFHGLVSDVAVYAQPIGEDIIADLAAEGSDSGDEQGLDLAPIMLNQNASAFLRVPFSIAEGALDGWESLALRVSYDDGFVAYLNGVEIARRNAPKSTGFNSAATAAVDGYISEDIFIGQHLDLLGEGGNVLAVHLLNSLSIDDDVYLDADLLLKGSLNASSLTYRYFTKPTPGGSNEGGLSDPEAVPTFDPVGGTFLNSREITITPPTPDAIIRYTLDGSMPTESSEVYTGPIKVNSTTRITARPFAPGEVGGAPASASFIKISQEVANFTSPLPVIIVENFGQGQIPDKRAHNPPAGDGSGIRQVPRQPGALAIFGAPASGSGSLLAAPSLITNIGIRVRGSSSSSQPLGKENYSIESWNVLAEDDINISPFGLPAESDWALYAPYNYDRALIRNAFAYEIARRMGHYAARMRFVEVFVHRDGGEMTMDDLSGFFVFFEKVKQDADRVDIEPLSEDGTEGGWLLVSDRMDPIPEDGGAQPRHFHTKGPNRRDDNGQGDDIPTEYNTFMNFVDPDGYDTTEAQRQAVQSFFDEFENALYGPNFRDPETGYAKYIDLDSFIDHYIIVNLTRNVDGLQLSTFMYRPDERGKLHLNPVWDYDRSMDSYDGRDNSTSGQYGRNLLWFPRLFDDPNFEQRVIDRWQELRRGPLSDDAMDGLIQETADAVTDDVADRNFSLWGGGSNSPRGGSWRAEIAHMSSWLQSRANWLDGQHVDPVSFSLDGNELSLSAPGASILGDAEIRYTLNNSDPRGFNGEAAGTLYSGPLTLSEPALVTARTYDDGEWSGPTSYTYLAGTVPATSANLVISEVMYHPADVSQAEMDAGFLDRDEFEYIELLNVSGSEVLDLTGLRFVRMESDDGTEGVEFDFAGAHTSFLYPGERVMVVEDETAFRLRYGDGPMIAGEYSGSLSNAGETVTLLDVQGDIVAQFRYSDDAPWPDPADGGGRSITLKRPDSGVDYSDPANWRVSVNPAGTPGGADGESYAAFFAGDPLEDADGDGRSNLLEYALGSDPTMADALAEAVVPSLTEEGTVLFTLRRNLAANDATLTPEYSTDAFSWNDALGENSLFDVTSWTVDEDGVEIITLSLPPENTRVLLRLRATLETQ